MSVGGAEGRWPCCTCAVAMAMMTDGDVSASARGVTVHGWADR